MLKRLNNKGFTLIEVLTVIVVITSVMMITIPMIGSITKKNQMELYHSYETMMEEYAMASNIKNREIIELSELDGLEKVKEDCQDGYVSVTYYPISYQAYIKCGNKYKTEGYGRHEFSGAIMLRLSCDENTGLCEDPTVSGRKVYRGDSVNNYIFFAERLWRIMAVEPDGKLKLIDTQVGTGVYDTPGVRTGATQTGSGSSFCSSLADAYGCSAWSNIDPTNGMPIKGGKKSTLNSYLNNAFYNNLGYFDDIATGVPIGHGKSSNYGNLQNMYDDEMRYTTNETVSILSASDLLKASSNAISGTSCAGRISECLSNNWITNLIGSSSIYLINSDFNSLGHQMSITSSYGRYRFNSIILGGQQKNYFPVIFLNSDSYLSIGTGTIEDPYHLMIRVS